MGMLPLCLRLNSLHNCVHLTSGLCGKCRAVCHIMSVSQETWILVLGSISFSSTFNQYYLSSCGYCCSHSVQVFLLQLNISGNTLIKHPKVCLPGDNKSNQVDNESLQSHLTSRSCFGRRQNYHYDLDLNVHVVPFSSNRAAVSDWVFKHVGTQIAYA